MIIPEKYQERYDRLAKSHPWMQEMRDETETIGDLIWRRTKKIEERNHLIAKARNSFKSLADNALDADRMRKGCRLAYDRMDEEMERMGIGADGRAIKTLNVIDGETNVIADGSPLVGNVTQEEYTSLSELSGNLSDSREKLEADVRVRSIRPSTYLDCTYDDVMRWLDRQAAITERELCAQCDWPSVAAQPDTEAYDRIDELTAERDSLAEELSKAQELCAARGKTIESLERFVADRKEKFKDQLVQKTEYCKTLKADREQYRKLYEAAMSTDYAQVTRERDELREQIKQIRSIITDETPDD